VDKLLPCLARAGRETPSGATAAARPPGGLSDAPVVRNIGATGLASFFTDRPKFLFGPARRVGGQPRWFPPHFHALDTDMTADPSRAPRRRKRNPVARLAAYLWASPNSAIGLLFVPLALLGGGGVQVIAGVVEVYGGICGWILRRLVPLHGGASAMTLGHVVLGRSRTCLDLCRAHEHVHVRQCERWGPLFLPAYALSSAWAWWRGGHYYRDNRFEREAYGDPR
jgi:hypothetical protein